MSILVLALAAAVCAVPEAAAQDLPKAPEAPKTPEAPEAPKLPDAPKTPEAPEAPKTDDASEKKDASKTGDGAKGPTAPGVPEDIDIVLTDEKPKKKAPDDLPPTLPRELKRNLPEGSRIAVQDGDPNKPLTVEEVVNPPIVSASKRKESAQSAPAWAVVVTARDLKARGYNGLAEILDDLPAMDTIRPYGDFYVKSYVRGQRTTTADTFLLLVDGMLMDDLLFATADILAALPLSNVEQVEIVYGPASALYGPNAATGVINVVTKSGDARVAAREYGLSFDSKITFGGAPANFSQLDDTTKILDATAAYIQKDYRLRLTVRFEDGALDKSVADYFEYTKSSYYGDSRLWGEAPLQETNLRGEFYSLDQKLAVDARLMVGTGTEIGGQLYSMSTGLGTVYPADQDQQLPWNRQELNAFIRHRAKLSSHVDSTTLIQLRKSDIRPTSSLSTDATTVTYETVEAPAWGVFLVQDFSVGGLSSLLLKGDDLRVGSGLQYNHTELALGRFGEVTLACRNYDIASGADSNCDTGGFLDNQFAGTAPRDQVGAYLTARYAITPSQALHLGGRADFSSIKEELDFTFRGGYTGTFADALTLKAMFGQAVFEPGGFGVAQGVSIPDQRSQTAEITADFTHASLPWLGLHADGYLVHATDVGGITTTETGGITPMRIPWRMVTGLDVGATVVVKPIRFWAYYSRILTAEEVVTEGADARFVGDIAFDKAWAGLTFDWAPVTATLLGRIAGPRLLFASNPTTVIDTTGTLDGHVMLSDIFVRGLRLGFRVTNILDARYDHPGIWTADSGNTAGSFAADGSYTGSQGAFNSRLPQPGRAFFGTIGLALDPPQSQ